MKDRPNILWLTYEDTSPQFVSCYGQTPVVTTPRIDALARDGVRFDHVYASAPVCSASRTALITGVCNEATGLGHHRSKYPLPRATIKGFPYYLRQAGYYATNNLKTDYNIVDEQDFIDETWDESSWEAHWRNRPDDRPFFSVFNMQDSHQSRTMTKPWRWYQEHVLDELPPDEIVEPGEIAMPPFFRDTPEMRRHVSRVYNSLRLCDRRIGERLDELAADGLMDETIIFCFADHGEGIPRGKANGIGLGYRAAFVAWFPEKYRHLSPWQAATVTDELISFEDLAPSMLALAGLDSPKHMTGRALLGERRREPRATVFAARNRLDDTPDCCRSAMDGRFVYTRVFFPHLPEVKYQKYADVADIMRQIRRDHAAGLLDETQAGMLDPRRPRETLYDLRADPWETRDCSGDVAYADDLRRLREATFEHMREVRDVMLLPERDMIAQAEGSTPYERRDQPEYNPLEGIIEAADLVGDPSAVDRQVQRLDDPRSAVRYWAAVGLFAARDELGGRVEAIRSHLRDPSPSVAIELAAALAGACDDDDAKGVLAGHIAGDDALLAHQAISRALYAPAVADDLADVVAQALERMAENAFGPVFPAQQAAEMCLYLHRGAGLYYEPDREYLDVETSRRDW